MNKKKREMIIQRGDDDFAHILAYHRNPEAFPLSEKQQEKADRWYEAFILLLNKRTPFEIVNLWKEKKGLSMAQIYRDIKDAKSLYGDVLKGDPEAERAILIMDANDYYRRAKEKGDMKSEGKALEIRIKLGGFLDEDNAEFNAEKLANLTIEYDFPKAYMDILKDIASKGYVDLNNLNVIDVEHEDIPTDET
nr:hypothetical protein [uncultured Flavobacterium sp.]